MPISPARPAGRTPFRPRREQPAAGQRHARNETGSTSECSRLLRRRRARRASPTAATRSRRRAFGFGTGSSSRASSSCPASSARATRTRPLPRDRHARLRRPGRDRARHRVPLGWIQAPQEARTNVDGLATIQIQPTTRLRLVRSARWSSSSGREGRRQPAGISTRRLVRGGRRSPSQRLPRRRARHYSRRWRRPERAAGRGKRSGMAGADPASATASRLRRSSQPARSPSRGRRFSVNDSHRPRLSALRLSVT